MICSLNIGTFVSLNIGTFVLLNIGTFVSLNIEVFQLPGFELLEILLVPHGGSHNDTICTVERKKTTLF
jgi:hypothetical protein